MWIAYFFCIYLYMVNWTDYYQKQKSENINISCNQTFPVYQRMKFPEREREREKVLAKLGF